ncbi:hypothetical protein [Nitrosomonas aestuarii]|uniref:Uncharacterized protein n=1 Tax=Nitrosomonas aestuarii TaxID=52441 RepID=A0A1I3X2S7_9PROT|nr:hypothetical protein [Nitrosomonas aestuarii]PTN12942.1 hypothetical protein C8R11_102223 [Nitrosomonas aestuarii]SFK13507.1 hypothetical protein SAMN05216302_100174 [Nitrosomonas aestuarii]
MITVKKIGGVCKALNIVNGVEKVVCTEGQKVPVGLDTYTVERQNNKCGIFLVKTEVIDGEIVETLILKCEEGQFV